MQKQTTKKPIAKSKTNNNLKTKIAIVIIILLTIIISGGLSITGYRLLTSNKPSEKIKSTSTPENTCEYNGKIYNNGDTFNAIDRCNECICVNGSVSCTEITCNANPIPDGPPEDDPYAGWKIYGNENLGLQLKYPADWALQEKFYLDPLSDVDSFVIKNQDYRLTYGRDPQMFQFCMFEDTTDEEQENYIQVIFLDRKLPRPKKDNISDSIKILTGEDYREITFGNNKFRITNTGTICTSYNDQFFADHPFQYDLPEEIEQGKVDTLDKILESLIITNRTVFWQL